MMIETAKGNEAINEWREQWQALFQASGAPAFLSWEWIEAWQRKLGRGRTPYLLGVRDGDELVALLPLAIEERRVCGLTVRRLSFLGEALGGADYLDVIARPDYAETATAALLDHLLKLDAFDVLELDDLAADSRTVKLLRERIDCRVETRNQCPQVELHGDWNSYLKANKRADEFKRKLRWFQRAEGFAYRTITDPAEIEAAFARYLALHESRWREHGGSDATGHEALRAFQLEAVKNLAAAGLIRFEELWAEGACRASLYGLDGGKRHYFYNTGYDLEWRKRSPGFVILGLSIQAAAERGVDCYDFLRGSESYKFDWANAERTTVRVTATRRNLRAMLYVGREQTQTALREKAKTLLPTQIAEYLRHWVRRRRREKSLEQQPLNNDPLPAD